MWVAIRQFDGALVAGQRKKYMPGDAVPEAAKWRNPTMWRQWITQVPDTEVVNGRWIRYEEVMLRGAKPTAKSTPPAHPGTTVERDEPAASHAAQSELQQQSTQTACTAPADDSAATSTDAAASPEPVGQQADGEKPRRRRRGAVTS